MGIDNLKNKKILVVAGGWSDERNVSLQSGRNVFRTLASNSYEVIFFDLRKNNLHKILNINPDLIFNSLHGEFGEDGGLTCFANENKISITHSDQVSSSLCMDKTLCKNFLKKNLKIKVPKTFNINSNLEFPLIIKPNKGGSSLGVEIIKNKKTLDKKLRQAKNDYLIEEKIIIEKELTVTVIQEKGKIKPLGVTEIIFNSNIYDYKAKYTKGASKHIIPADITKIENNFLMTQSKKIFKLLGCKSIARIDFIMKKNSNGNIFFFLEVNTHPGLTSISLAPEQAKTIGMSYLDLINKIMESANESNIN